MNFTKLEIWVPWEHVYCKGLDVAQGMREGCLEEWALTS